MNSSADKLKTFERVYLEEQDAFFKGKPFPPELDDQEFLSEYREWRVDNKDMPLMDEASRQFHVLWEQRERAKTAHKEETGA